MLFVNYGRVSDFDTLAKYNISCKDKILIARYGKTSRVFKVRTFIAHLSLVDYFSKTNENEFGINNVDLA